MHSRTRVNSLSRDVREPRLPSSFFFFLPPFARSSVVDLNAVSYLTQLPRATTLTLAGLTLINTIFFTRTAGQCWR